MRRPSVLIVDDAVLLGDALVVALRQEGIERVRALSTSERADAATVLEQVASGRPEVVLLDLVLGNGLSGLDLIRPIRHLGAAVLVLTVSTDAALLGACLEAGAIGVFDKGQPLDDLVPFILDASSGVTALDANVRQQLIDAARTRRAALGDDRFRALTRREAQVLSGLIAGKSSEEIAAEDAVAVSTVRSHVKGVFRKLGVNSRVAAVALARSVEWPMLPD